MTHVRRYMGDDVSGNESDMISVNDNLSEKCDSMNIQKDVNQKSKKITKRISRSDFKKKVAASWKGLEHQPPRAEDFAFSKKERKRISRSALRKQAVAAWKCLPYQPPYDEFLAFFKKEHKRKNKKTYYLRITKPKKERIVEEEKIQLAIQTRKENIEDILKSTDGHSVADLKYLGCCNLEYILTSVRYPVFQHIFLHGPRYGFSEEDFISDGLTINDIPSPFHDLFEKFKPLNDFLDKTVCDYISLSELNLHLKHTCLTASEIRLIKTILGNEFHCCLLKKQGFNQNLDENIIIYSYDHAGRYKNRRNSKENIFIAKCMYHWMRSFRYQSLICDPYNHSNCNVRIEYERFLRRFVYKDKLPIKEAILEEKNQEEIHLKCQYKQNEDKCLQKFEEAYHEIRKILNKLCDEVFDNRFYRRSELTSLFDRLKNELKDINQIYKAINVICQFCPGSITVHASGYYEVHTTKPNEILQTIKMEIEVNMKYTTFFTNKNEKTNTELKYEKIELFKHQENLIFSVCCEISAFLNRKSRQHRLACLMEIFLGRNAYNKTLYDKISIFDVVKLIIDSSSILSLKNDIYGQSFYILVDSKQTAVCDIETTLLTDVLNGLHKKLFREITDYIKKNQKSKNWSGFRYNPDSTAFNKSSEDDAKNAYIKKVEELLNKSKIYEETKKQDMKSFYANSEEIKTICSKINYYKKKNMCRLYSFFRKFLANGLVSNDLFDPPGLTESSIDFVIDLIEKSSPDVFSTRNVEHGKIVIIDHAFCDKKVVKNIEQFMTENANEPKILSGSEEELSKSNQLKQNNETSTFDCCSQDKTIKQNQMNTNRNEKIGQLEMQFKEEKEQVEFEKEEEKNTNLKSEIKESEEESYSYEEQITYNDQKTIGAKSEQIQKTKSEEKEFLSNGTKKRKHSKQSEARVVDIESFQQKIEQVTERADREAEKAKQVTEIAKQEKERADREAEKARQEKERADREAEKAKQVTEIAKQEKERADREAEKAKQEKERADREIERINKKVKELEEIIHKQQTNQIITDHRLIISESDQFQKNDTSMVFETNIETQPIGELGNIENEKYFVENNNRNFVMGNWLNSLLSDAPKHPEIKQVFETTAQKKKPPGNKIQQRRNQTKKARQAQRK